MVRQRMIVGIGEALLVERPDRVSAGGLALDVARHAQRAGHVGIAISRIGQDAAANELLTLLAQDDIDATHLQSDPDLKTGQLVIRSLAGRQQRRLDPRAAFDNLQWDFDLDDVAQEADGVVFGLTGCRDPQARSVHDRFLEACPAAVKVCDLTNVEPDAGDVRGLALSLARSAEVAIVNEAMLRHVLPGSGDDRREALLALLREADLTVAAFAEADQPIELHSAARSASSAAPHSPAMTMAMTLGLLHGLLAGWDLPDVVRCAARFSTHDDDGSSARIPDDVLQGK